MLDLAIEGGRVVTPGGVREMNVGVAGGRIATLSTQGLAARTSLDASGLLVLPGMIDTHMHIGFHSDETEVATETAGAAVGGITTALIYYRRLTPYGDDLEEFIERGRRQSVVDFAVHLGILTDEHMHAARSLSERFGITSFKMYTCYKDKELEAFGVRGEDDGFMLDAMSVLARIPGAVVNVHSENNDIYEHRAKALRRGEVPGTPLEQWSWTRPPIGEAEAVQRVALLAREAGAELFIPHVGSKAALDACRAARAAGTNLHVESCPHYLLLDAAMPGPVQYAKVNPPVRAASDRSVMVGAVARGEVDTIGTDHAAIFLEGKANRPVADARPGFPGVDVMLPALMELVHRGDLPLERLAELPARSAAIFGLRGKGRLEVGYDADLVLVDPARARTVRAAELRSASDLSVYEGMTLTGWPTATLVRGQVVARDGEVVRADNGAYVRRGQSA
jgi:dihydropyrimidinase